MLTYCLRAARSNRQRLRTLQVRRLGATSVRRAQQSMVRRSAHLLRIEPRDGLPRSMLPVEQRRGLRQAGVLQLHSPETAERGAREGAGALDEEVVEGSRQGRAKSNEERDARAEQETGLIVRWEGLRMETVRTGENGYL